MRHIKITNRTHWQTKHLRAFAVRAANQILDDGTKPHLTIEFSYNRGGTRHDSCSGRAWIGGSHARVMVPSGSIDKTDLASVIAHELAHCRGVTHAQMRGASLYRRVGNWREHYAWAETLPLEKVSAKPKRVVTPVERANAKLNVVRARLKQWQTRLKRAQTAIQKYRAQEKYYLRREQMLATQPAAKEGK